MATPEITTQYRVLVVEDTDDQREIISISLRPMEVVAAVNGLDGLMKIDRVEPDFIVSDIMMPEMDGWEFIQRVRGRPGYQKTPVVYLTALTSREDMKRGYETGADVYLTKPYDPLRLKRNLEVYIDKFKLAPRPKKFTLDELKAEEKRLAEWPPPKPRMKALDEDADPFKAPRPASAAAPTPPPKPAPKAAALPPRLLLVATDENLGAELDALAKAEGFELMVAYTSPAAMDITARCKPDALCLHWQLPRGHASALAQLFTQSPDCKSKPLVVITDKKLGGTEKRLLPNLGVFEVLRRPIQREPLCDLLADIDRVSKPATRQTRPPWSEVEKLTVAAHLGIEGKEQHWEG